MSILLEKLVALGDSHLRGGGAVAALEEKFERYYNKPFALATSSATNGLYFILQALGIRNSEIITTALSYGATIAGALQLGNKVHFAGVDEHFNMCPVSVRKLLSTCPDVKAIIAVDYGGTPCEVTALRAVADEAGVSLIVDAAQSFGATINELPAGHLAHALVTSFCPGKTLYSGEGGMIVTDDRELYARLLFHSQHPERFKLEVRIARQAYEFGLNGRPNPLSCLVACEIFETSLEQLTNHQARILEALKALKGIIAAYHLPLLLPDFSKCVPTFFHCLLLVDGVIDENLLQRHGIHATFSKTTFIPLYRQMRDFNLTAQIGKISGKNSLESRLAKCYRLMLS